MSGLLVADRGGRKGEIGVYLYKSAAIFARDVGRGSWCRRKGWTRHDECAAAVAWTELRPVRENVTGRMSPTEEGLARYYMREDCRTLFRDRLCLAQKIQQTIGAGGSYKTERSEAPLLLGA